MPKRSNEFQRLIALIESGLAQVHSKNIKESAFVWDESAKTNREVDVLIKGEVNGHPVQIALECRDHKAQQSVKWIDELIGKYRDTPVDKIIAVSKSGFTKSAIKKASQNRIEALSFTEALDTNWPQHFIKGYIKFIALQHALLGGTVDYKGKGPGDVDGEIFKHWMIFDTLRGKEDGTVEQVTQKLYELGGQQATNEFFDANQEEIFANDKSKEFRIEVAYDCVNSFLVSSAQIKHEIAHIYLNLLVKVDFISAENERYFYNGIQITVGSLRTPKIFGSPKVVIAQFPGNNVPKFKLLNLSKEVLS